MDLNCGDDQDIKYAEQPSLTIEESPEGDTVTEEPSEVERVAEESGPENDDNSFVYSPDEILRTSKLLPDDARPSCLGYQVCNMQMISTVEIIETRTIEENSDELVENTEIKKN